MTCPLPSAKNYIFNSHEKTFFEISNFYIHISVRTLRGSPFDLHWDKSRNPSSANEQEFNQVFLIDN